jgi:hypothetical protein
MLGCMNPVEERAVQPFYLTMMGLNAIWNDAERATASDIWPELVATGRALDLSDVLPLLTAGHWRPMVMGGWFSLRFAPDDVGRELRQAMHNSAGSLTAPPPLAVACVLIAGKDSLPDLEHYVRADPGRDGSANFVAIAIEHLGGGPPKPHPGAKYRNQFEGHAPTWNSTERRPDRGTVRRELVGMRERLLPASDTLFATHACTLSAVSFGVLDPGTGCDDPPRLLPMFSGYRKLSALTVAALTAGLMATTAQTFAAVDVARDIRGDAARFPSGCDFVAQPCGEPDASNKAGDITKFRTSYQPDVLVLSTSLRSLPTAKRATLDVSWDIRTSGIDGQRVRRYFVAGLSLRNGRVVPASTFGANCIIANAEPKLVRKTASLRIRLSVSGGRDGYALPGPHTTKSVQLPSGRTTLGLRKNSPIRNPIAPPLDTESPEAERLRPPAAHRHETGVV